MKTAEEGGAAKHLTLRTSILEGIRRGEFVRGGRLPSERELALRFGVSYMTARRAVTAMVEENTLERRGRAGTFVLPESPGTIRTKLVHLLCAVWDNSIARSFVRQGVRVAEENGWDTAITYLRPGDEIEAIRIAESGAKAILLPHADGIKPALSRALENANRRVVVVGSRHDHRGIPSVMGDNAYAVRMAVSHLRDNGHQNIALVFDHTQHPVQRVVFAAWRAAMESGTPPVRDWERMTVNFDAPDFDDHAMGLAYEAVCAFLASERSAGVTAMACVGEEAAIGAVAACRDCDCPTPDAISVVEVGHSVLMSMITPPVTSVELSIARHLEAAFELLQRSDQEGTPDLLRLVEPKLIPRQSVRAIESPTVAANAKATAERRKTR